jgi:DNA-binding transcriptional MerR regulator
LDSSADIVRILPMIDPQSATRKPASVAGRVIASSRLTLGIAAVERDTGLPKDTLRVWERRYGFPQPERDEQGGRAYSQHDVEKLRVLRHLLDAGHRPGRIVRQPIEALRVLAGQAAEAARAAGNGERHDDQFRQALALVGAHDFDALRASLSQAVLRLGLGRFLTGYATPLGQTVREACARGVLEAYEERLFIESMLAVVRHAIAGMPPARGAPRVLLASFPHDGRGLGLLMAEALFGLEACTCWSLGTQAPLLDIVRAAEAQPADIVVLSSSSMLTPGQVHDGLADLRAKLPAGIEIWVGGRYPTVQRRLPAGVVVLAELADIARQVARWHGQHARTS